MEFNIDKIKNASLSNVRLINFKIHDDFIFNIHQLNDIYGQNRVGKSSIVQAIETCLFPSKKDVDKIKHGKDFCELIVTFEVEEDGEIKSLTFSTKISKNGTIYTKDKYNDVLLKKVSGIRSSLVSVGTFDPRKLLDKKDRTQYLLKILPLKIKKEELLKHLELMNEKAEQYKDDAIYKNNGFMILKDFEAYIRNIRHSKGLVKEERLKSYEKRNKDYKNYYCEYEEKHGQFLQNIPELKQQIYSSKEKYKLQKDQIGKIKEKITINENSIIEQEKTTRNFDKIINDCNESIKDITQKMENLINSEKEKIINFEKQKIQSESMLKQMLRQKEENNTQLLKINKDFEDTTKTLLEQDESLERIHWQEKLIDQKQQLKNEYIEVESALKEWGLLDNYIKNEFKDYKLKKIDECLSKIESLEYKDNKFIWNNTFLNELSDSEIVELGMKISCLDEQGSNFISIDCAESLDENICKNVGKIANENKKKLILIRVANKPLNDEFNSVEVKRDKR